MHPGVSAPVNLPEDTIPDVNSLGFRLLRQLSGRAAASDENVFLSPVSVSTALAMAGVGATDGVGRTPLHTAAALGLATAVTALLAAPGEHIASVTVDGVDHLRPGEQAAERPVPRFGLTQPDLFKSALRVGDGLVLLLEPTAVAQLTASKERDI